MTLSVWTEIDSRFFRRPWVETLVGSEVPSRSGEHRVRGRTHNRGVGTRLEPLGSGVRSGDSLGRLQGFGGRTGWYSYTPVLRGVFRFTLIPTRSVGVTDPVSGWHEGMKVLGGDRDGLCRGVDQDKSTPVMVS